MSLEKWRDAAETFNQKRNVFVEKYRMPVYTDLKRPDEIEYAMETQLLGAPKENYAGMTNLKKPVSQIAKEAAAKVPWHRLSQVTQDSVGMPSWLRDNQFMRSIKANLVEMTRQIGAQALTQGSMIDSMLGNKERFEKFSKLQRELNEPVRPEMQFMGEAPSPLETVRKDVQGVKDVLSGNVKNPFKFDPEDEDFKEKTALWEKNQKRIDEFNERVKIITDDFLQRAGLARTEEDGWLYDAGSIGSSLLSCFALTVLFRNPTVLAGLFGASEAQGVYEDAVAAGIEPAKAYGLGSIAGGANALLEEIGGEYVLQMVNAKGLISRGVAKALAKSGKNAAVTTAALGAMRGGTVEGIEEALQSVATDVIENMGGVQQKDVLPILQDAVKAGVMGSIGGMFGSGPAAYGNYIKYQRHIQTSLENVGVPAETAEVLAREVANEATGKELSGRVLDAIESETDSPFTADERDAQAFGKAFTEAQSREIDRTAWQVGDKVEQQSLQVGMKPELAKANGQVAQTLVNNMYRIAQLTPKEFEAYKIEVINEGPQGNLQEQFAQGAAAMYRSPHKHFEQFYKAAQENKGKKQSFYTFTTQSGVNIDVPSDTILHDKKHPEMDAKTWKDALTNLDSVQNFFVTKSKYGQAGADVLLHLKDHFGVELTVQANGRVLINTAFKSTQKGIEAWINKEKSARMPDAFIFDFRPTTTEGSRATVSSRSSIHSIADIVEKIKGEQILNQEIYDQNGKADANSPAFKKWFGNSQVVDENGQPLVVHHGTNAENIQQFDRSKASSAYGSKRGFFFAKRKEDAGYGGIDMPVYLSIQNPYVVDVAQELSQLDYDIETERAEAEAAGYPISRWEGKGNLEFEANDSATAYLDDNYEEIFNRAEEGNYDGVIVRGVDGSETYVAFEPTQIKSVYNKGTFDSNDANIYNQAGYHGSPHRFDRFDLSHIGSGEGAQAHGWGIYIAGERDTAEEYRNALIEREASPAGVNPFDFFYKDKHYFKKDGRRYASDFAWSTDAKVSKELTKEEYSKAFIAAQEEHEAAKERDDKKGQVYEVDIPEKNVLLDEQKVIAKQPAKVKKAIIEAMKEVGLGRFTGVSAISQLTGGEVYDMITSKTEGFNQKDTSMLLLKHGIKGITYDGRRDGRCYVIFDDKAINILETYYQKQVQEIFQPEQGVQSMFKQEVKKVLADDSISKGHRLDMGRIPRLYVELGLPDSPLKTNKMTLLKAVGKEGKNPHNVPMRVLEELPKLVADPKAVFKSSKDSMNPDGYVVVLDAVNDEGKPIVAIISPNKLGEKGFSFIPSVYDKDNFENFISKTAAEDGVVYIKDKGSDIWGPLQLRPLHNQNLINSIKTKEQIVKGLFEKYNQNGEGLRGQVRIDNNAREAIIRIFEGNYDPSTVVHELAHVYLSMLHNASKVSEAAEFVELMNDLHQWLGEPTEHGYSVEQQEKFARAFEAYLAEGQAPNAKLQSVFEKFAQWLAEVYDSIKDYFELTPEVKSLFDRLMTVSEPVTLSNLAENQENAKAFVEKLQQGKVEGDISLEDVKALVEVYNQRIPKDEAGKEVYLKNLQAADAITGGVKKAEALKRTIAQLEEKGYRVVSARDLEMLEKKKAQLDDMTQQMPSVADYENPTRDFALPAISTNITKQLKTDAKSVLLKKNIIEKNKKHHPELDIAEYNSILLNTLYDSDMVLQVQKKSKPNYFTFIKEEQGQVSIVEINADKPHFEIVGFFKVRKHSLEQYKNKTTREGGHILITKGNKPQGAAGLSALPSDTNSLTNQDPFVKGARQIKEEVLRELDKRSLENKAEIKGFLEKAQTPKQIRKAVGDVLEYVERAYAKTEEGKQEHSKLEIPHTDYGALKVKILKDLNRINTEQADKLKEARETVKRLNRIQHRNIVLNSEEDAALKKAYQTIRSTLDKPYQKAVAAALQGIAHLPAADKGKFIRTFIASSYVDQVPYHVDGILRRAKEIEEKNYKKYMEGKIKDLLEMKLFSKNGTLRTANLDQESTAAMLELRRAALLTEDEATNELAARHERFTETIPSPVDKIINGLLSIRSEGIEDAPMEVYKAVYDGIAQIRKAGRDSVALQKMIRDFRTERDIKEVDEAVSKNKEAGAAKKVYARYIANWESILDLVTSKDLKEKYSMLSAEADAQVYFHKRKTAIMDQVKKFYGITSNWDLQKKINDLLTEDITVTNYSHVDRNPDPAAIRKGGKPFEETLTKMQVLNLYIWSQNATLNARLETSYGQAQLKNLFKCMLDEKDRMVGDLLQREAENTYGLINEVFIRERGYALPRVWNYFPSVTERVESDIDFLAAAATMAKNPSFIKNRVDSRLIQMKPGNPFSLLFRHIERAADYHYKAEKFNQIRRAFKNGRVKQVVAERFGEDVYDQLVKMIDQMSVQQSKVRYDIDKIGDKLTNNFVKSAIGLRPAITIKQLISSINYSENMPAHAWTAGFIKAVLHPKETIAFMTSGDPYIKTRFESGGMNEAVSHIMASAQAAGKRGRIRTFLDAVTTINTRLGDVGAITFGGRPYVEYLMNERGMTKEQAFEEFRKSTLRSQQAGSKSSLSAYQARDRIKGSKDFGMKGMLA